MVIIFIQFYYHNCHRTSFSCLYKLFFYFSCLLSFFSLFFYLFFISFFLSFIHNFILFLLFTVFLFFYFAFFSFFTLSCLLRPSADREAHYKRQQRENILNNLIEGGSLSSKILSSKQVKIRAKKTVKVRQIKISKS